MSELRCSGRIFIESSNFVYQNVCRKILIFCWKVFCHLCADDERELYILVQSWPLFTYYEEFEDTKEVIRIGKSKWSNVWLICQSSVKMTYERSRCIWNKYTVQLLLSIFFKIRTKNTTKFQNALNDRLLKITLFIYSINCVNK